MLILKNGNLIDGIRPQPVENAIITIDGNRFSSISQELNYPEGAEIIDLKGATVMPGLIDCHLHLGGFIIDTPGREIGKVSFFDAVSFFWDYFRNFARRRQLAIENGVTSIRSAGDNYPQIIQLREKIQSGKLTGPRIFSPGPIFTAPGGHPAGTIYRRNKYIVEHATRQVSDTSEARGKVQELVAGGVDCIKAIYSDINAMNITHKVPKLDLKVLEAIIDEAHRHNLRVMVHAGNPDETRDAVEAGADSIEHGILPGTDSIEFQDNVIEKMVERGTYYVPTLAIAWAYRETYPELFSAAMKVLKQLHDAGVNIALGTDSGAPGVIIGKAAHKEMELMVEAGLSPIEAIKAATINAAHNLGKGTELGAIEAGRLADMVAISDNPLENIGNIRDIVMVINNGEILLNRIGQ